MRQSKQKEGKEPKKRHTKIDIDAEIHLLHTKKFHKKTKLEGTVYRQRICNF